MGKLEVLAKALLESLQETGVPAALAGGMAANAWVEQEDVHLTYDVDAVVLVPDGHAFSPEILAERIETRTGIRCFHGSDFDLPKARIIRVVTTPDNVIDDLNLADRIYSAAALARTGTVELGGAMQPILAPEDVILFKSLAGRDKDRIAIAAIGRAQRLDRGVTWRQILPAPSVV